VHDLGDALIAENGVLDVDDAAQAALAQAIRSHVGDSTSS